MKARVGGGVVVLLAYISLGACADSSDPTGTDAAPEPGDSAPSAAQLLAKMSTCNRIGGLYRSDAETAATIPVCGARGGVFWHADMDIDCDGVTTAQCNINTDPWYQDQTSLQTSTGQHFNAATMPYVVIPSVSSRWSYASSGIELGAVVAVIHNGRVEYGVFADTGPEEIIGEASYAMAVRLGVNPDPAVGGVDAGVSYLVFPGSRVSPVESHAAAVSLGRQLAQRFVTEN